MKLLLLISLAVFVLGFSSTQDVFADTITISDESSCNALNFTSWSTTVLNTCNVINDYTISSGNELIIDTITLNVKSNTTLTNSGTITNSGSIRYTDGVYTNTPSIIANNGTINNYGYFGGSNTLNNYGTITNPGILFNGGGLRNFGAITNSGTLYNSYGNLLIFNTGYITNFGTINNPLYGIISNWGNIYECQSGKITGHPVRENQPVQGCSFTISDKSSCENPIFNFTWVEPNTCKVTNDSTIFSGFEVIIDDIIDFVVAKRIILINSGNLTNYGNITDTYDRTGNTGILNSLSGGIINNMKGGIFNSKNFVNSYSFNNFGILNNTGTINNWGNIDNKPGGTIYSSYMLNMANITINSNSTFNNNIGYWNNWDDSLIISNGTITINSGGILYNDPGRILNEGTIDNNGVAINSGKVANTSIFNNNNILENAGTFSNHNILDNGANNDNTGVLNNNGTIYNCGGTIPETGGRVVQGCSFTISDKSTCENLIFNFIWIKPNTCNVTDDYTIISENNIIIENNIDLVISERVNLTNLGNLTLNSGGTITNLNNIINWGNLTINSGGFLNNSANIVNSKNIFNSGTIFSECTARLAGYIVNHSNGTITNSGTIENRYKIFNWGTLTNESVGTITNYSGSCLPREADIYNTKTIHNYGIINSNGTIDNNVYSKFAPNSGVSTTIYSGGTLNNNVNGTFENFDFSNLFISGTFNNSGILYKCPLSHISGTVSGNAIHNLLASTCYYERASSVDPLAFTIRPDYQIKAGIPSDDVQCMPGLEKLKRTSNGNPICVSSSGAEKLIELGLAKKY